MARMTLAIGDPAPDFTLDGPARPGHHAVVVRRGDKAVLIVFYPFAFSGVCTGELTGLRDRLGDFETDDSTLVAVSCDPMYTQRAFADRDGTLLPPAQRLLAARRGRPRPTASSTRSRARRSGRRSSSTRTGVVRWSVHNDTGEARDLDAHAAAVKTLTS